MEKIKVGIIGCGRISNVYKEIFKKLDDVVSVVFCADKVEERCKNFSKDFSAFYSTDYRDIYDKNVDIVHICTPHFLHKEQTINCLKNGINVLCEKPISINSKDAEEMIRVRNETKKELGIIFQNRYISGIQELKRYIDEGLLGKITGAFSTLNWHRPPSYYECDWKGSWEKEGGGVLIDQAIHSIDLVRFLINSKVKNIDGRIDRRILKNIEVEDSASAAIEFENGAIYSLFACNYYRENSPIQIEIYGENGIGYLDGEIVTIKTKDKELKIYPSGFSNQEAEGYWGTSHFIQISECYKNFRENKPFNIKPEDAKETLDLVLGIYESSKKINNF